MIFIFLKYKFSILVYYLRWGLFRRQRLWVKYYVRFSCIMRKLKKRHGKEKALDIIKRYFQIQKYYKNKESQEAMEILMDNIAVISNNTGIKQWDLKEIVKRDFDLDL